MYKLMYPKTGREGEKRTTFLHSIRDCGMFRRSVARERDLFVKDTPTNAWPKGASCFTSSSSAAHINSPTNGGDVQTVHRTSAYLHRRVVYRPTPNDDHETQQRSLILLLFLFYITVGRVKKICVQQQRTKDWKQNGQCPNSVQSNGKDR
jgi:hypothetical protein